MCDIEGEKRKIDALLERAARAAPASVRASESALAEFCTTAASDHCIRPNVRTNACVDAAPISRRASWVATRRTDGAHDRKAEGRGRSGERLRDIRDEIVGMLDADRHADERRRDAHLASRFLGQSRMHRRRTDGRSATRCRRG